MNAIYRACTIAMVAVATTALSCAHVGSGTKEAAPAAVSDAEIGLEKSSVFADPDPIVAAAAGAQPGTNEPSGGYFSGSPPVIPHAVDGMLPITAANNMCLACHDAPDRIGEEKAAGVATAIPTSHYTDLRRDPGTVTANLIGARYSCTQCHAAQTDAKPLVRNTYGP
jgi:cytochrome c-type protein NapB